MTPFAFVPHLVAFSIQIALVVTVIAALMKVVLIPARARYACLRLALVACLVVPWLLRTEVGVTPPRVAEAPTRVPAAIGAAEGPEADSSANGSSPLPAGRWPDVPWTALAGWALVGGIAVRALWLAIGVAKLRRLTGRAVVVESPEYADAQRQVGTSATIAEVDRLTQPVTFGFRRPVVLLPDALAVAPPRLRRAVVTHELFHVRRGDWLSVIGEEVIRTVLWFHPAILWLTSHIQLAREEIVDELTVEATGDRRVYMQALLAFADTEGMQSAAAFAHRRQLFHRILSVSKEKAMSAPRIVMSVAALALVVSAASFSASALFPIVAAATAAPSSGAGAVGGQLRGKDGASFVPARDVRVSAPAAGLRLAQQTGAVIPPQPVTPENPIPRRTRGASPMWPAQLAGRPRQVVVSARVAVDRDGRVSSVTRDACSVSGNGEDVCRAFFDVSAAAIRQWQYERPARGPIQFFVTIMYRPEAEPTINQSGESWTSYIRETEDSLRDLARESEQLARERSATTQFLRSRLGELIDQLRELERAQRLALERGPADPSLLKLQRQLVESNDELAHVQQQLRDGRLEQAEQQLQRSEEQLRNQRLQQDADQLTRAAERLRRAAEMDREAERLERSRADDAARAARARALVERGLVTEAQAQRMSAQSADRPLVSPSGRPPVRVDDNPAITRPVPIRQVKPEHPLPAMQARVEGTVILEALVDEQGHVADARVIKSIPLLDQAAVDAARQWQFKPAMLNGEAVPVLIQLEMNFTLK